MADIRTEAWVLHSAASQAGRGKLVKQPFTFPDILPREVLAKPLYGCVEGNMLHALTRDPVDICEERGEESVVIGNAGVVVVEKHRSLASVRLQTRPKRNSPEARARVDSRHSRRWRVGQVSRKRVASYRPCRALDSNAVELPGAAICWLERGVCDGRWGASCTNCWRLETPTMLSSWDNW